MIDTDQIYEAPDQKVFELIDATVADLVHRVGLTGDGKHHLGFGLLLPAWLIDGGMPGKLEVVIRDGFKVAKERGVAIYFAVESHYLWASRPDLWNYFDPKLPGYNPANKNNVEWMDWKGTPYPHRYVDWGAPQELAPHMCYNCPVILHEVTRLAKEVIAPPMLNGIQNLRAAGKEYLFAGMTVTSEPSLDNYSAIDKLDPNLARFMDSHGAPEVRLGYNALTKAGYSETNPPNNLSRALAEINQKFVAFWAKQFVDASLPSSRLYTHIPANAGPQAVEFTNAPLWIASNKYSRMGFTTYPDGPLKDNFNVIYEELAKHGNPHWGGTEASPMGLSGNQVPPIEYLRRHFDHGATVVVMNTGATNPDLEQSLDEGVWSQAARSAYAQFLSGRLDSGIAASSPGTGSNQKNPCDQGIASNQSRDARLKMKIQRFQALAETWIKGGGDPEKVQMVITKFEGLLSSGKPEQAELKLDTAFKMMCEKL